ncbi:class I SAM-dependent methyltransferase [Lacibacter sp. MH-610]|uniref:class I SAM-dependent methyltransferase n=1 Tax=Lacibacter sp. MH-610 TaxID=3020883 RepID=UPI0038916A51
MRYITQDDFIETFSKLKQRGLGFLLSKFSLNESKRTISAFNEWDIEGSNWWMIPAVQQRWNFLITGSAQLTYEQYLAQKYLSTKQTGTLLSIGSGTCSHETELARLCKNWQFHCTDIAGDLLKEAKSLAQKDEIDNIFFYETDVTKHELPGNAFDIVFFHSSLHHIPHVHQFLNNRILPIIKDEGLVIINEYTGPDRLQYPLHQINAINELLKIMPASKRERYKRKAIKNTVSGPGLWRMIVADPSECVDSSSILPSLHELMHTIEEKPIGGNLLMLLFKDISHHFLTNDSATRQLLDILFKAEDSYLLNNQSDFIFGVYKK